MTDKELNKLDTKLHKTTDKISYTLLVCIAGIVLIAAFVSCVLLNDDTDVTVSMDDIANNITANGWVLYSTTSCPHCVEQKNVFGESIDYILIINCDLNENAYGECVAKNVTGVPTWINSVTGEMRMGVQNVDNLIEMGGI